jgi:hypothetical protein
MSKIALQIVVVAWAASGVAMAQMPPSGAKIPVNPDNFVRAETDLYAGNIVKDGGLGKFVHRREPAAIDNQTVVRLNRDTLYSAAVFDLDAGPVTIAIPPVGDRFVSMQVINEDQYTPQVTYGAGTRTLTRKNVGTRYVVAAVRTLVNPADPKDVMAAHAVQDGITVKQKSVGTFETPAWDLVSQKKVRDALLALAATLPDANRMFGTKAEVDPVRRLIGSASAWGGNPDKEAIYLNVTPPKNDGATNYVLKVKDVPVNGFWSVSLYNGEGYYQKNDLNAYSLNNITAAKDPDGSVTVRFGGCDGKVPNCLPIMKDWNYMVRLYRPKAEVLSGRWKFPTAQPTN